MLKNYELKTILRFLKPAAWVYLIGGRRVLFEVIMREPLWLLKTLWKRMRVQKRRKRSDQQVFELIGTVFMKGV